MRYFETEPKYYTLGTAFSNTTPTHLLTIACRSLKGLTESEGPENAEPNLGKMQKV